MPPPRKIHVLAQEDFDRLLGWLPSDSIESAIKLLTIRQRECIVLIFVDGCTEEEAAAILGVSRQAVQKNKSMGIQKLREMFHKGLQKTPNDVRR